MRENHAIVAQQMIRMNLVTRDQLEPLNVSRTQLEVAIRRVRSFYEQHGRFDFQGFQGRPELFGFDFFHIKRIDDGELAIGKFRRQRRAQRAQKLFARESVVVGAGLRSVHRAAMAPKRRANRADAGASGALLLPQFLARAGNLPAGLGGVRAAMLPGAVVLHRLPKQVFVDRAENLIGEIEGSDFLPAQIVNVNRCHIASRVARTPSSATLLLHTRGRGRPRYTYAFFAARFAAFNGSTVAEPANPRRSLGGFFALTITMYPPCGPGTLPSTTSRFSSLSTPKTLRLRCVTRSCPMCPDMRIPLNTREGNADEPIDPVIWNIDPCDLGPPPK